MILSAKGEFKTESLHKVVICEKSPATQLGSSGTVLIVPGRGKTDSTALLPSLLHYFLSFRTHESRNNPLLKNISMWDYQLLYTFVSEVEINPPHTEEKEHNPWSKGIVTISSRQLPHADQLLGRYVPGESTSQAEQMKGAGRALQPQLQPASTQPLPCPAASAPCISSALCTRIPTHHTGLTPHQDRQSTFIPCIKSLTGCPLECRLPSGPCCGTATRNKEPCPMQFNPPQHITRV